MEMDLFLPQKVAGGKLMYIFYRTYRYKNNGSMYRSETIITNMVEVHTNPTKAFCNKVLNMYGANASYTRQTGKLYIRRRARIAKVRYKNQTPYSNPKLINSIVENYILGARIEIDHE